MDYLRSGSRNNCLERTRIIALACAVLWTLPLSLVSAANQEQHLTQRIVPIPHPITSLLRSTRIHRELSLSAELAARVQEAVDDVDQPLWRLRDLPPNERNEQAEQLLGRLKRNLYELLSAQQMERLNQIVWQAQGVEAVLEPELAAQLKLSGDQIGNIVALRNIAYKRIAELRMNPQISPESVRTAQIQQVQADTQQKIAAVLSGVQKQALTILLGQPITLSQIKGIACKAPEIQAQTWINSPQIRLSDLRGKVTVVHFYAFGCGNCVRSLPYYNDWARRFDGEDFAIVGIHRPETERERDVEKVREKALQAGMKYPIAIDNDSLAWDAWGNHTWPTTYLIDKNGYVRCWWYGELNWQDNGSEKLLRDRIQELIRESEDT